MLLKGPFTYNTIRKSVFLHFSQKKTEFFSLSFHILNFRLIYLSEHAFDKFCYESGGWSYDLAQLQEPALGITGYASEIAVCGDPVINKAKEECEKYSCTRPDIRGKHKEI